MNVLNIFNSDSQVAPQSKNMWNNNATYAAAENPPPSPAPSSDRFVLGIPSPSLTGHHHHHQQIYQQQQQATTENKFSTIHHRSMSPSSR